MSTSEEYLNLNSDDMISYWSEGYMRNPILKFSKHKAKSFAEDQFKLWEKSGVCFDELLEDFKQTFGAQECPKNLRTGKPWDALLRETMKKMTNKNYKNQDAVPEIYPHALVQSTIKYFKSKGPTLTKLSILEEEKERVRVRDSR